MAWNEPGGNNQDPWGGGNRGNNGGPPDLDEALKKFQEKIGKIFGGTGGGSGSNKGFPTAGIGLVVGLLFAVYLIAGIKIVDEQEQGVVLRLGVYDRTMQPGINWAPPGIESVYVVNFTRVRVHRVSGIPMLTGDLNIVDVDLSVQYRITNSKDFVLNVRNPEESLRQATDSALRHVVGSTEMQEVLTEGRSQMGIDVQERLQEYLNNYQTGIQINTVNVEETSPPNVVQSAFDDVNKAREDEERLKNEAQAYSNQVVPEARGTAQRMLEEAEGYKQQVIAQATGEAQRFENLLAEYEKAPLVTRERLYLDAVQEVMANSSKIMVDVEGGNNLLYLPLDKMVQQAPSSVGGSSQGLSAREIEELERRILDRVRAESPTTLRRR